MRFIILFLGIFFLDSLPNFEVFATGAEADNGDVYLMLFVMFIYAIILDLWKKV